MSNHCMSCEHYERVDRSRARAVEQHSLKVEAMEKNEILLKEKIEALQATILVLNEDAETDGLLLKKYSEMIDYDKKISSSR